MTRIYKNDLNINKKNTSTKQLFNNNEKEHCMYAHKALIHKNIDESFHQEIVKGALGVNRKASIVGSKQEANFCYYL